MIKGFWEIFKFWNYCKESKLQIQIIWFLFNIYFLYNSDIIFCLVVWLDLTNILYSLKSYALLLAKFCEVEDNMLSIWKFIKLCFLASPNLVAGFICQSCGRSYRSRGSFWCHVKYDCPKIKSFICHLCDFKTKRKFTLKKHFENRHITQMHEFYKYQ